MNPFKEILTLTNGPDQYELVPQHGFMKLKSRNFPWSIKQMEFDLLRSLVVANNLKRGFEIATGIGISSTALGLGFQETGGKLVTMDSYVEDLHNHPESYRRVLPTLHTESINLKSTQFLINHYKLQDTVFPEVGWSPRDTGQIIKKHFTPDEKLDFLFLDGGHFPEQIAKDLEGIVPYLSKKSIVVFHDMFDHTFNRSVKSRIAQLLGKEPIVLLDWHTGFSNHLGIVNNL
jgi:predicted O-methyltransferase YrrM